MHIIGSFQKCSFSHNSEEELEWILNESKETKQEQNPLYPTTSNPPTRHQKGKEEEEEQEVEEEKKEQDEEEKEGERLLDVLTEELSNEDIENELTNLQRRVSDISSGGFTVSYKIFINIPFILYS